MNNMPEHPHTYLWGSSKTNFFSLRSLRAMFFLCAAPTRDTICRKSCAACTSGSLFFLLRKLWRSPWVLLPMRNTLSSNTRTSLGLRTPSQSARCRCARVANSLSSKTRQTSSSAVALWKQGCLPSSETLRLTRYSPKESSWGGLVGWERVPIPCRSSDTCPGSSETAENIIQPRWQRRVRR